MPSNKTTTMDEVHSFVQKLDALSSVVRPRGPCMIVFDSEGKMHSRGDSRFFETLQQYDSAEMGMSSPTSIKDISISFEYEKVNGNFVVMVTPLDPGIDVNKQYNGGKIQTVKRLCTKLLDDSTIEIDANGKAKGYGLGHHIARALNSSDAFLKLKEDPEFQPPMTLSLEGVKWGHFFSLEDPRVLH